MEYFYCVFQEKRPPVKPVDLTIPLILPKSFTRPPPLIVPQHPPPGPPLLPDFTTDTIPLKLPSKQKLKTSSGDDSPGLLSSLTEEELVKKAAEMLGETDDNRPPKKQRLDNDLNFDIEPAIPGVDN